MESIFGVPASDIALDDLRNFFDSAAGEEPLLWEAKADAHPRAIRKHVCGFANALGGWLILGVSQERDERRRKLPRWRLTGVEIPQDEPTTWISDLVTSLRSAPRHQVRAIDGPEEAEKVYLIEVDPVTVPPCITPDGFVYERVSGKTVPVTEPLVLLNLTQRGQALREGAEQRARAHAEALAARQPPRPRQRELPPLAEHPPVFALALAAVGRPSDIALRPFRASFFERFRSEASERLITDWSIRYPPWVAHSQGASWVAQDGHERDWATFAHRDGTIAVMFASDPDEGSIDTLTAVGEGEVSDAAQHPSEGPLAAAWRFAADMLGALGCFGEARLAVAFNAVAHKRLRTPGGPEQFWINEPTEVRLPSPAEYDQVVREVNRACGRVMPEPE